MSQIQTIFAFAAVMALTSVNAQAGTDSGCWVVQNVTAGDSLNVRQQPSHRSAIVDRLVPGQHGIIGAIGQCGPSYKPWPQRWCPISHSSGNYGTTRGWVKARYIRPSGCP